MQIRRKVLSWWLTHLRLQSSSCVSDVIGSRKFGVVLVLQRSSEVNPNAVPDNHSSSRGPATRPKTPLRPVVFRACLWAMPWQSVVARRNCCSVFGKLCLHGRSFFVRLALPTALQAVKGTRMFLTGSRTCMWCCTREATN